MNNATTQNLHLCEGEVQDYKDGYSTVLRMVMLALPMWAMWYVRAFVHQRNIGIKGLSEFQKGLKDSVLARSEKRQTRLFGSSLLRKARGLNALRRSVATRAKSSGAQKFTFPSDVLLDKKQLKALTLGVSAPVIHYGRAIEIRMVARALEDASACTHQSQKQRVRVRLLLGHLAVMVEPFFTFGILFNLRLRQWQSHSSSIQTMASLLIMGFDLSWLNDSTVRHVMSAITVLEASGVIPLLYRAVNSIVYKTHEEDDDRKQSTTSTATAVEKQKAMYFIQKYYTTVKYEILLIPIMKIALGWLQCEHCVNPVSGKPAAFLGIDSEIQCNSLLQGLLGTLAICTICRLYVDAVLYALNEMNQKEPIFRYDPTFFSLQVTNKVGIVTATSFLGVRASGNYSVYAVGVILLLAISAAIGQYSLIPCFGERRVLNNYRFAGFMWVIYVCLVLIFVEILYEITGTEVDFVGVVTPILLVGSLVTLVIAWYVSDRRARQFALKEFSHISNNSNGQGGSLKQIFELFIMCKPNSYPFLVSSVLITQRCHNLFNSTTDQSISAVASIEVQELDKRDLTSARNLLRLAVQSRGVVSISKLYHAQALALVELLLTNCELRTATEVSRKNSEVRNRIVSGKVSSNCEVPAPSAITDTSEMPEIPPTESIVSNEPRHQSSNSSDEVEVDNKKPSIVERKHSGVSDVSTIHLSEDEVRRSIIPPLLKSHSVKKQLYLKDTTPNSNRSSKRPETLQRSSSKKLFGKIDGSRVSGKFLSLKASRRSAYSNDESNNSQAPTKSFKRRNNFLPKVFSSRKLKITPEPQNEVLGMESVHRCIAYLVKTVLVEIHFDERFIAADAIRCLARVQRGLECEYWNMKRAVTRNFKGGAEQEQAYKLLSEASEKNAIFNHNRYCNDGELELGCTLAIILQGSRWDTVKTDLSLFSHPTLLCDVLKLPLCEKVYKLPAVYPVALFCLFRNLSQTEGTKSHVKDQHQATKLRRDIIANVAMAKRAEGQAESSSQFNALKVMTRTVRRVLTSKNVKKVTGDTTSIEQIIIATSRLLCQEPNILAPSLLPRILEANSSLPAILSFHLHSTNYAVHDAAVVISVRLGLSQKQSEPEWVEFPHDIVLAIDSAIDNMNSYLDKVVSKYTGTSTALLGNTAGGLNRSQYTIRQQSSSSSGLSPNESNMKQVAKYLEAIEDVLRKYFVGTLVLNSDVVVLRMVMLVDRIRGPCPAVHRDLLDMISRMQRLASRL